MKRPIMLLVFMALPDMLFAGPGCLLSARPDAAGRRLLLSFDSAGRVSASARAAEMGIEINSVMELAEGLCSSFLRDLVIGIG